MNDITIEQIVEALSLKKADNSLGLSLLVGCTFWEVGIAGAILTDYNVHWDESLPRSETNILKTMQLVMIILPNDVIILSAQAALDVAFVRAEIQFHISHN